LTCESGCNIISLKLVDSKVGEKVTRRVFILMITIMFILVLWSCTNDPNHDDLKAYILFPRDHKASKIIRRVETFPDLPKDFQYLDYKQKGLYLDELVFSFAESNQALTPNYNPNDMSTWQNLGWFDDARVGISPEVTSIFFKERGFGVATYVGDRRSSSDGPYEAITALPMVLGSSLLGINKSNQTIGNETFDFVHMTKAFYNTSTNLVLNTTSNTVQGQSIWYDLYPQITFARLYDLYQSDSEMKMLVLKGADRWLNALPYMVNDDGDPDFVYTGFDLRFNVPVYGNWFDPPNGGLAFIFYSAYQLTHDVKYIEGAKAVLDYFQSLPFNPNYEALTDFAPWVAAILNRDHGTNYDIGKMIDFLFENDAIFRPNWSILSGEFNGYPVDGLVGDQDYAFAMNSFNLASTLAPLAKYDVRYADAIGKYFLNLTNNAKWFFPREIPLFNQTMTTYLSFDLFGAITYEGFRRSYNNVSPLAMGDATTLFTPRQPSDLSLYSASHIGYLGSIVNETNVKGILELDLNATDSFGDKTFPTHLYYNPYDTNRNVRLQLDQAYYDLFDSTTKEVIARNVTGDVTINIPAKSSRIILRLPAHSKYEQIDQNIYVNDTVVASFQASVNIVSPGHTRFVLRPSDVIRIAFDTPKADEITLMRISFNEIVVYEGEALNLYNYDKSLLPDTDYELKVEIWTKNNLYDQSSTRIIAN
jgi:hypothetical protein